MAKKADSISIEQSKKAAITAFWVWLAMMLAYGIMGVIANTCNIYMGQWVNILFLFLCAAVAIKSKESLKRGLHSLGFVKEKMRYSCGVGLICGAVIVALNGTLTGVASGWDLAPAGALITWLLYYMFFIALPEEIIFRGYILTRFEEAMENSKKAVVISGVLFTAVHIPYQYIISGQAVAEYFLNGNLFTLLMTFVWHLVFCIIYKKTGAIYGSILFHGIMDWSNHLF